MIDLSLDQALEPIVENLSSVENDHLMSPIGFNELANSVGLALGDPTSGIINPDFTMGDEGWQSFGAVSIVEGVAVISSAEDRLYSDLSQTFLLSANTTSLQFTISSVSLQSLASGLGDAFEVALLNSETGSSLLAPALGQSDALLNLQADGVLHLGSGVSLLGRDHFVSGELVETSQPLTFVIDLSGIETAVTATLFFDLLSVSGESSTVSVDDIVLQIAIPNNIPPVAFDDEFEGLEDSTISGNILNNDSDNEGDDILFGIVEEPTSGAVTFESNGDFVYSPNFDFFGTDSFSYRVSDLTGEGNIATVILTVDPVNDSPSFRAGGDVNIVQNGGRQIVAGWARDIIAGPVNEGDQSLQWVITFNPTDLLTEAPQIDGDGNLIVSPAEGAFGSVVMNVTLVDNGGDSNGGVNSTVSQNFTINILPVNEPPAFVIGPDLSVVDEDGPQVVENWITDISPGPVNESDQTVQFVVTVDQLGLFSELPSIDSEGTLRYSLVEGASGEVVISVRARDNGSSANGGSNESALQTATLTIERTVVNSEPPTIVIGPGIPDPYWLQVNTLLDLPVTWTVGPGRIGTVTVSSGPSWSSVSGDGNRLTGVPLRGHPGISEIWVTVTDDLGATVTTSITIQLFRPWDLSRKWLEVPLFEGVTSDLLLEGDRIEIPITAGQWPIETVSNTTASDSSIRTFNVNQQPLREMASGYEAEIVYAGADGLFGTDDDIRVQVETSVVDDRRKRLTVVIPPKGPSGPARLEVKVAGRVVFSVSI